MGARRCTARIVLVLTAVTLAMANAQPASWIAADGDFADADWSVTVVNFRNVSTETAQQEPSGGNPGAYLSMTDTMVAPSGLAVARAQAEAPRTHARRSGKISEASP